MEKKTENPFPQIELFRPLGVLRKLAHGIFDQMHYDTPNTGAAPMLDKGLYDGTNEQTV